MDTGLIETIRVREGVAPFLARHLDRLRKSAAAIGIPFGSEPARAIAEEVAHCSGVLRVELRASGVSFRRREAPASAGGDLVLAPEVHRPYPHKTTDRARFDAAHEAARAQGAADAVFLTGDGAVAEGAVTSVFGWLGSALWTPPLDLGILPGVGRARVLELAGNLGVEVRQDRLAWPEAVRLPLFLVNAVRGIVQPDGVPTDLRTSQLSEVFWG